MTTKRGPHNDPNRGQSKGVRRYHSLDPEAKQRYRDQIYSKMSQHQAETAQGAVNNRQYWTEEEDLIVLDEEINTKDAATLLGRTYQAILSRRYVLYQLLLSDEPLTYHDGIANVPTTRQIKVLCPCGTVDDDHDEWCPQFTG